MQVKIDFMEWDRILSASSCLKEFYKKGNRKNRWGLTWGFYCIFHTQSDGADYCLLVLIRALEGGHSHCCCVLALGVGRDRERERGTINPQRYTNVHLSLEKG